MTIDFGPATGQLAQLTQGVRDDQLGSPTPCADYTLGDLLDHVGALAVAFANAAAKRIDEGGAPPAPDASRLGDDWRTRIPADLAALAEAWRDADAWAGMTRVGGVDLPGGVAGLVALDEVVVHGWDVARASGQRYETDPAAVEACHGFVAQFVGGAAPVEIFGPPVDVPEDAPMLDRLIGITGRDPGWSPSPRA
jgi:uncharacterized protein (TIGR03086 family)